MDLLIRSLPTRAEVLMEFRLRGDGVVCDLNSLYVHLAGRTTNLPLLFCRFGHGLNIDLDRRVTGDWSHGAEDFRLALISLNNALNPQLPIRGTGDIYLFTHVCSSLIEKPQDLDFKISGRHGARRCRRRIHVDSWGRCFLIASAGDANNWTKQLRLRLEH